MKLSNEDYVARISSATALQLVVITYEVAIEHISDAIEFCETDKDQFQKSVSQAKDFLASLIDSLDLSLDIGRNLMAIYIRVNKLLIDATFKNDVTLLKTAKQMMENLLKGWQELEKDDKSMPVMNNPQQIYAGLTYGKEGLTEYIPENTERGFKV